MPPSLKWLFNICLLTLCYSQAHADNQIQYLAHGEQSLAARTEAVESAKHTIDFTTFVFEPCDSSTKILIDALIAKAKTGVKVRLIIDAYSSGGAQKRADLTSYFAKHNIELRYYAEGFLGPGFGRSHIKLLLIDGKYADARYISGGRNASDGYYGLSQKTNYLDNDFYVTGETTATAQQMFEKLWASYKVGTHSGKGNPDSFAKSCLAKTKRDKSVADYITQHKSEILNAIPVRSCSQMSFFMDDDKFRSGGYADTITDKNDPNKNNTDLSDTQLKYKHTTRNYLNFLSKAHTNLLIVNQYYLPVQRLKATLKKLRTDKIKVMVYTNLTGDAPGANGANMTQLMLQSASKDNQGTERVIPLSSLGSLNDTHDLTFKSAKGQWRIHTKTVIRDNQDIFLGSYNMDDLSYKGNLEEGMIVNGCPELLADVKTELSQMNEFAKSDAKNCAACKNEVKGSLLDLIQGQILSGFF